MKLISSKDYEEYCASHNHVEIGEEKIPIGNKHEIEMSGPPVDFRLQNTTVWSFPDRGDWATHKGDYRGNWSPYIPRNLILKYAKEANAVILDQMVGSGTTLVEAKLLGKDAIGVDINPESVILTLDRLNFEFPAPLDHRASEITVYNGDARNLSKIGDNTIDLVVTHPPYWRIIPYSKVEGAIEGDLSAMRKLEDYVAAMEKVADESFRVLRPGRHCAILIGDTRMHRHYVPISSRILQVFLEAGFILNEDIVKLQHNMKTTREKWYGKDFEQYGFHLIAHEQLFVFRKPKDKAEYEDYPYSIRW